MIMKLFIKPSNRLLVIKGIITEIILEDELMYRELLINPYDNLIISIKNEKINLEKNCLFINNPLDLDVNTKKNISFLHKILLKKITSAQQERLISINNQMVEFINEQITDSNYLLDYENIELSEEILSLYGVKFLVEIDKNYLEKLIQYLKINIDIYNYSVIIANNITNYLSKEEQLLLEKELTLLGIPLINIGFKATKDREETIIIDNYWNVL